MVCVVLCIILRGLAEQLETSRVIRCEKVSITTAGSSAYISLLFWRSLQASLPYAVFFGRLSAGFSYLNHLSWAVMIVVLILATSACFSTSESGTLSHHLKPAMLPESHLRQWRWKQFSILERWLSVVQVSHAYRKDERSAALHAFSFVSESFAVRIDPSAWQKLRLPAQLMQHAVALTVQ